MIVAPNVSNVIGVFTMGFGIMASVLTNNVSALVALANGLLPLRRVVGRPPNRTSGLRVAPADMAERDQLPLRPPPVARMSESETDCKRASVVSA